MHGHYITHSTQHIAHNPQQQQQPHRAQGTGRRDNAKDNHVCMFGSDGSAETDSEPDTEAGAQGEEVDVNGELRR